MKEQKFTDGNPVNPDYRAVEEIYCKMLGHNITFSYCIRPGSDIFCRNIAGCWAGRMDIESYLAERFTEEEIDQALKPKPPKILSLLELIEKAKSASQ